MANTSRSTTTSGAAWRTIDSARPTASTAIVGPNTRSAPRRAASALRVSSSGSPGPTPTPTRDGRNSELPQNACGDAAAGDLAPGSALTPPSRAGPGGIRGSLPGHSGRAAPDLRRLPVHRGVSDPIARRRRRGHEPGGRGRVPAEVKVKVGGEEAPVGEPAGARPVPAPQDEGVAGRA